jgi:hypothetical protein
METKTPIYTLTGRINEIEFKKRTPDLKKTIMELKPEFVFCDTYFTLSKGSGADKIVTERKLNLKQGKQLFNNEMFLDVFIDNLLIEFN